jgi:hypothetical protein
MNFNELPVYVQVIVSYCLFSCATTMTVVCVVMIKELLNDIRE